MSAIPELVASVCRSGLSEDVPVFEKAGGQTLAEVGCESGWAKCKDASQ